MIAEAKAMLDPVAVESVMARQQFGIASAQKRGRNPKFPYVPVIQHAVGGVRGQGYQEQLLGRAFVERAQAVAHAEFVIRVRRAAFERHLKDPRHRALREQWGLPREIAAGAA